MRATSTGVYGSFPRGRVATGKGVGSAGGGRRVELGDLDLRHLQHRLHDATGDLRIRAAEVVHELLRDHLPGEPEFVLQPAALVGAAAVGEQRVPVVVDLVGRVARDEQRERRGELVRGTAVEQHETLPEQLDRRRQQSGRAARTALRIVGPVDRPSRRRRRSGRSRSPASASSSNHR